MRNLYPNRNLLLQFGVALLLIVPSAALASAEEPKPQRSFELQPGVIVDRGVNMIYAMDERGGIAAIDIKTGKEVWRTEETQKPLDVTNDLLLTQAASGGEENAMRIIALDKTSGKLSFAATQPVPEGVRPAVTETLEGKFFTTVNEIDTGAIVQWTFVRRPRTGLPPQRRRRRLAERPAFAAAADDSEKEQSGAFQLNLTSGKMSTVDESKLPHLPPTRPWGVKFANEPFVPDSGGLQVLSADGQHVMVSKRQHDQPFYRYLLVIYDQNGKRLGELPSATSVVPFFVSNSQITFATGPSARREGDKLVAEGLQLRSADLKTGKPIWSRPIRDTKYRGPLPP